MFTLVKAVEDGQEIKSSVVCEGGWQVNSDCISVDCWEKGAYWDWKGFGSDWKEFCGRGLFEKLVYVKGWAIKVEFGKEEAGKRGGGSTLG
jgi:hypothetical protein